MKLGTTICNPFLTLACDFGCPYCITRSVPGYDFGYKLRDCAEWADALNNLEDVQQIVFNGGEPTLRPGFADLMNALTPTDRKWPAGWKIAVGSNGSERARKAMLQVRPRGDLIMDLSFHPSEITLPEIVSTALALRDHGHNVRVHTITWPGWGVTADWFVEQLRGLNISAFAQPFDGWYNGEPCGLLEAYPGEQPACDLSRPARKALCHRTIFTPVAPNGDVYICHSLMYAKSPHGIIGNIFDGWMSDAESMACDSYGHCNACDRPRRTEVIE